MKHLFALILLLVSIPALAAPCALVAAQGDHTATLTWTAPTTHVDGTPIAGALTYNVYRSTTSGAETLLISGVSALTYADTSLASNTTYYYQATAVETATGLESAKTAEGCKSFPASPPNAQSSFTVK